MNEIFENSKLVVFDVMGVIFTDGNLVKKRLYPMYKEKYSYDFLKELYVGIRYNKEGDISLWRGLGERNYVDVRKKLLDSYELDGDFESFKLMLLEKGFRLGILSNMPKEWAEYITKKLDLKSDFSPIIFSGQVGMKKPDLEIYDYLIQQSGYKASDMVFIDDKLKNLKPANDLGIKTVYFKRKEDDFQFNPNLTIEKFSDLY